jgi:hypothetical protein
MSLNFSQKELFNHLDHSVSQLVSQQTGWLVRQAGRQTGRQTGRQPGDNKKTKKRAGFINSSFVSESF